MTGTVAVPYIDVQHDALAVFDDVEQGIVTREAIWVSAYKKGSESVHGKFQVEAKDGGGSEIVEGTKGMTLTRSSKTNFLVSVPSLDISHVPVRFARQIISPPFTKPTPVSQELHINSIAFSDKVGQLVVGGPDGYCVVLSPTDPSSVLELKGHVGDVQHVRWFPSGEVVLTASSDLTIRIFSAKNGINPRTLKGHTRAITATHIIGVGKQVLSSSKDGSVRLWDVGQGAEIRKWTVSPGKFVDSMVVVEDEAGLSDLGALGHDRVILAASPDGIITAFALSSDSESQPIFSSPSPTSSKLLSITYSPVANIIATGHADGAIVLRRLRALCATNEETDPSQTVLFKRNEAPILALTLVDTEDGTDLLVGTGAGLPCRLKVYQEDTGFAVYVKDEYAGWEALAIETWAVGTDGVWCAGGDKCIRRY